MATAPTKLFVPVMIPMTDQAGNVREEWRQFFQLATTQLFSNQQIINTFVGVNRFTVATQPSLGAGDVGFVGIVTDLNHVVWWDGSNWQPWAGDVPRFVDLAAAPFGAGYQLCDGTVTSYLTFGPTLTLTPFTTPNLIATPAYRKAAAAYTGAINAKSGSTGTGTTGTGTTSDDGGHTPHIAAGTKVGIIVNAGSPSAVITVGSSTPWEVLADSGGVDLDAVAAHHHTVPALSVPALGAGSIEMANLGCLPFFRR